jgi:hypothetical protein
MGVKFFDYDNDGRLDLFVTDMHSDMSEEAGPDGEKAKSHMTWPESYLQGGANNIWGNAPTTTSGAGSSRRSPTAWASRTTGPGASAWAT